MIAPYNCAKGLPAGPPFALCYHNYGHGTGDAAQFASLTTCETLVALGNFIVS